MSSGNHRGYRSYTYNYNERNRGSLFPLSFPLQSTLDEDGSMLFPSPYEEPFIIGRFGIPENVFLDNRTREVNPRPRELIQRSHPEYPAELYMQSPTTTDDPRSTPNEQNKVLKMLRKEQYNPGTKYITRRLCLYYRNPTMNNYNDKKMQNDEEGKRCPVCLEDFEPREDVMLTPCNHMFHEDCIMPWVKSHSHCPVCRALLE